MKRTKKKLKIKWKNIALLMTLLVCACIAIYDAYMVTIYSWIKGVSCGWTWFGFLTFLLAFAIGGEIIEYFIDEFKE